MPKRDDIRSILVIGAGPIVIGQACEFDYSGAQACKALKDEGYRVILVNSNPATIMTDPSLADATYIEPIEWRTVSLIIEKERPDALLPTMGGQTALNCALDLAREGVLQQFDVELIGAKKESIDKAEDREKFDQAMKNIGLETPRSSIAHSLEEALQVQAGLGFPCIIRPSFTLGGSGGGIAYNQEEFKEICERGFDFSPTKEFLFDDFDRFSLADYLQNRYSISEEQSLHNLLIKTYLGKESQSHSTTYLSSWKDHYNSWKVFRRFNKYLLVRYEDLISCLLYTSPSPRDVEESRMPSSA